MNLMDDGAHIQIPGDRSSFQDSIIDHRKKFHVHLSFFLDPVTYTLDIVLVDQGLPVQYRRYLGCVIQELDLSDEGNLKSKRAKQNLCMI